MTRFRFAARPGAALLSIVAALASCLAAPRTFGEPASAEAPADSPSPEARARLIVVVGASGTEEYETAFRNWAETWRLGAEKAGAEFTLVGGNGPDAPDAGDGDDAAPDDDATEDRTQLQQLLAEHAARPDAGPLWLVLVGHGSFDGSTAKYNLRGPDVSAKDFAAWLEPIKTPLALVDCTSASAPFLNAASAPGRVVIVATKSGFELNFARFGKYIAEAIVDPRADLDKDDQVSLLEAYLTACRGVAEFYAGEQRLATEHALLDDNGDGLGTPADWFRGIRATQRAKEGASLDGLRAHQLHLIPSNREARLPTEVRRRRDELELKLAALRDRKSSLAEDEYYEDLELLLVELARLYEAGRKEEDAAH